MGRALLAIAIVTLLWAGNFTAAKIGTAEMSPFLISSIRVFAAAAAFYAMLRDRAISRSDFLALVPLAITGIVVNQTAFAMGIRLTSPSHSAVIHALIPVFVAILAIAMIRERLGPVGVVGMILAVAGALVVVAPGAEWRSDTFRGDLLTLLGAVSFSVYTVLGRRVLQRIGTFKAVTWAFVIAAPFMIPNFAIGLGHQDWSRVTWKGWAALGYMIVAATLVCYTLHLFALSRLKAGQVAIFTDLQPALGTGIAVLAGLDTVTPHLVIGGAIAIAGVALVQLRR